MCIASSRRGPLRQKRGDFMKMEFPAEPPISKEERMKILMNIRDEDIDLSDMPELTEEDFARGTRVGDRFIKRGQRNLAILNVLLSDHERVAAAAASIQ